MSVVYGPLMRPNDIITAEGHLTINVEYTVNTN
jgi:hypothetical protein